MNQASELRLRFATFVCSFDQTEKYAEIRLCTLGMKSDLFFAHF